MFWQKWIERMRMLFPAPSARESSDLKLGTGDRLVFRSTKSSDELAHETLKAASEKAKDMARGSEVTIEITENYRHIHNLELMVSFMTLADKYGLRFVVQFNNKLTFKKL